MRVLEALEPKKVFYFFEELCRIPHGSGNIEKISNYLKQFAIQRKLEHYQDEIGNVIMIKEATAGYEFHEPIMIQGHMDMVAVKKPDCDIDMKTEGLRLKSEGDRLYAEGTSLGGDDGIAVAYGLALLDGSEYKHPRIELVITVDEEVGMDGARVIDLSPCKATRLLNIDSEEEGIFLTGCAGGASVMISLPYEKVPKRGIYCKVKTAGLKGGHSGAEIHKERGNANSLLGRYLYRLGRKADFCLINMAGGLADNAIPREAEAEILITSYRNQNGKQVFEQEGFSEGECLTLLRHFSDKYAKELRIELASKDSDVSVMVETGSAIDSICMEETASFRAAALLNALPCGVQAMSGDMPGLVETSLNIGILSTQDKSLNICTSVRSSIDSSKEALINKLGSIAALAGAGIQINGDYPGWAYRKESPLRDKMIEVYENMYQRSPQIQAIHAGLECGLFAHKISGLDCVSIGPDMKNIHTTEEELSISSTSRVWSYLLKLLEEL